MQNEEKEGRTKFGEYVLWGSVLKEKQMCARRV